MITHSEIKPHGDKTIATRARQSKVIGRKHESKKTAPVATGQGEAIGAIESELEAESA